MKGYFQALEICLCKAMKPCMEELGVIKAKVFAHDWYFNCVTCPDTVQYNTDTVQVLVS